jgi:choline transport protein
MNYTCACVGGFLVLETAWWFVAGKKYTAIILKAKEENHVAELLDQNQKRE